MKEILIMYQKINFDKKSLLSQIKKTKKKNSNFNDSLKIILF